YADGMQLVPNQASRKRLIGSMDAPESSPAIATAESPFVLKCSTTMSGNSRWLFIGAMIGAMLLSIGGIVFSRYRDANGEPLQLPKFIKARTESLEAPGSDSPPAAIVIQLSADMVRVS